MGRFKLRYWASPPKQTVLNLKILRNITEIKNDVEIGHYFGHSDHYGSG